MSDRWKGKGEKWSLEEIALLRAATSVDGYIRRGPLQRLSEKIGRTTYGIQLKAQLLREQERGAPDFSQVLLDEGQFADTMRQAIEAGLERPPMVGVDMRPGTKKPIYVEFGTQDFGR